MKMQNPDQRRNRHIQRSFSIIAQALTSMLFMIGVAGSVGMIIYGLMRIALFDRTMYAYFFAALCVLLFGYLLYRLVKKGRLSGVLRKTARVLIILFMVLAIIALLFLYGSLFVRAPLIAYVSSPFVLFFLFYLLPRFNALQKIRRFFS